MPDTDPPFDPTTLTSDSPMVRNNPERLAAMQRIEARRAAVSTPSEYDLAGAREAAHTHEMRELERRLVAEEEERKREKAAADAAEAKKRQAEIDRLDPEGAEARRQLRIEERKQAMIVADRESWARHAGDGF